MKAAIIYCHVLLLVQFIPLLGQSQETKNMNPDTIRFLLTKHNNIAVESILNEEDTIYLMFHTDVKSVSLTPDQTQLLNKAVNKKSSRAKSWSGSQDVEYVEGNRLEIANLQWSDLTVWLNMLSGHETGGKFGTNLFKEKLIEINFNHQFIVLHDDENSLLYPNQFQTFDLSTNENNSLFIEGELIINDRVLKNKFLIHSGYGGTMILDDQFCKANPIIETCKVIEENDLKDSLGNIIKTKKARASKFQIFNTDFEAVPFSYFDSDLDIQKTSVLGGEMLKRFNLLLDVENMKLHVKPNKFTSSEFKS